MVNEENNDNAVLISCYQNLIKKNHFSLIQKQHSLNP